MNVHLILAFSLVVGPGWAGWIERPRKQMTNGFATIDECDGKAFLRHVPGSLGTRTILSIIDVKNCSKVTVLNRQGRIIFPEENQSLWSPSKPTMPKQFDPSVVQAFELPILPTGRGLQVEIPQTVIGQASTILIRSNSGNTMGLIAFPGHETPSSVLTLSERRPQNSTADVPILLPY